MLIVVKWKLCYLSILIILPEIEAKVGVNFNILQSLPKQLYVTAVSHETFSLSGAAAYTSISVAQPVIYSALYTVCGRLSGHEGSQWLLHYEEGF